eukprot:CAMPEP_0118923204 /NCGR_PEP_ID=MMETSP1169-20130426/1820_1 /TAXON_ID=36882 /ORGANISM="Pyramimonas obovata, Strain CCMP722" /LENGTH=71 /DNA_ID=CAMNT_0006864161 /DNA_START=43 /DNA_END=254 /DNA_ORIENTATION=+
MANMLRSRLSLSALLLVGALLVTVKAEGHDDSDRPAMEDSHSNGGNTTGNTTLTPTPPDSDSDGGNTTATG